MTDEKFLKIINICTTKVKTSWLKNRWPNNTEISM